MYEECNLSDETWDSLVEAKYQCHESSLSRKNFVKQCYGEYKQLCYDKHIKPLWTQNINLTYIRLEKTSWMSSERLVYVQVILCVQGASTKSLKSNLTSRWTCSWLSHNNKMPNIKIYHFNPLFQFYTPQKRQKTFGFLTFSGGIKMEDWVKIDYVRPFSS